MATVADDPPEERATVVEELGLPKDGVEGRGGVVKAVEEVEVAKPSNGSSSSVAIPSGPPILHPTDTTWQWLFAASDMAFTPSAVHSGMPLEQERYLRWKGVQLIFRIGDYMRLGNHVTSTASVFFHRFYMRRALPRDFRERAHDTFTYQEMAPTCVFLACKVEETHRKLHGVVEATMAVNDRSAVGIELAETRSFRPDVQSKDYRRYKDLVLLHEERLLETLCFDLIVEQPHPVAIKACKRLGTSRDMAQLTVILLNTIIYGAVCTFYDAATLAAGAFQQACNLVDVDPASYATALKTSRTWYNAFEVDQEEVDEAMPDIEGQVAYHNERISSQQVGNASKPYVSTPHAQQHTSLLAHQQQQQQQQKSSEADEPAPTSFEGQQKQLHFAEDAKEETLLKRKGGEEEHQGLGESEPALTRKREEKMDERDSSMVQREDRTDPSRPISRHGSKGANQGPPPPLSFPVDDGPVGEGPAEEEKESGEESEGDPHEEAAAEKVHQEQIQQEEAAMTSEEEGAL